MRVFTQKNELIAAIGEPLGSSDWLTIEQKQIDTFAEATGDRQWIHLDFELAKTGPFGKTIAHGFLTLSLIPIFAWQVYKVNNVKMGINYGLNKVRFTAPVPVGSRLRGTYEFVDVSEVDDSLQITTKAIIELEGSERPACVAETMSRLYF